MSTLAQPSSVAIPAPPHENAAEGRDWAAVMNDLLHGRGEVRELALLRLNRLLSGFLRQLGAWDMRDDWSDLRQTVLLKLIGVARGGGLRDEKSFVGYARVVTRNAYYDLLRARRRETPDPHAPENEPVTDVETRAALSIALESLPERIRLAVWAVYVEGHTYDEASRKLGVPFGTLKRDLQTGLRELQSQLKERRQRSK